MTLYRWLFWLSPLMALPLLVGYLTHMTWLVVPLYFGVIPLLDALIGGRRAAFTPAQQAALARDPMLASIPWVNGLVWLLVWAAALWAAPTVASWGTGALVGWIGSLGLVGGALGIVTAHELVHRNHRGARALGGVVLASVCYGVFKVEHVRGHHLRVGTADDPATARRGESVYAFIPRAMWGVFTHAFVIEATRLKRLGLPAWHWRNESLQWVLLSVGMLAATYAVSGAVGITVMLGASLIAILLLEVVDYIEHYGLTRTPGAPVQPQHSWDSDAWFTNSLTVNLQRHADHHAHGGRAFGGLNNHDSAPQMPFGYATMVLLALVPPAYRALVEPRLDALLRT
jgi:alkane 1-monooxygenase